MTDVPVVARGADDPPGRLLDLDIEGIDTAVLYPTYGLMIQGVVERGPAVALCRAVNDWLASYCAHDPRRRRHLADVHRLDEHLEVFGYPNVDLTAKPSEQFRRQCFVSVEEVEPGLADVLAGYPECVVFASDYPHADGTFPGATKELLDTDELDDAARRRVLRDNAVRLYSLEAT